MLLQKLQPVSLRERVLQAHNNDLFALVISYDMLKVIPVAVTLFTGIHYKQLLKRWNQTFILQQEFGNRPVSPSIQNTKLKQ
jgi:hypothetical protein